MSTAETLPARFSARPLMWLAAHVNTLFNMSREVVVAARSQAREQCYYVGGGTMRHRMVQTPEGELESEGRGSTDSGPGTRGAKAARRRPVHAPTWHGRWATRGISDVGTHAESARI